MLCSLVKTQLQFQLNGCENCEEVLNYKGDIDKILECTSPSFEGTLALLQPTRSWVGKWQRIEKFQKGIYAIDIQEQLLDAGIRYRSRDGTSIQ